MKDAKALIVEQLSVNYDKTPVLWDLNFSIPKGKLVGIIGPNGAGKSTLLKALLGIIKPLSGKIEFLGEPYKKVHKRIAYVPQRTSVDWDFPITVIDVVLMGHYGRKGIFGRIKPSDRETAFRALRAVGLEAFADRQIGELSGGQQQKVFLARALVQDAEVYLMDEPFAGVDMATEKVIISILDELKKQDKTLFVVHHDLQTVDQYFDWVILLNTSLIAHGPVEEVFHKENLMRTYGGYFSFLEEAAKIAQKKNQGIR
jgi:manganese/zinc/iron transport system ATP- binding protein